MIKKISAIALALVLCLSVVVMPASAAVELGSAKIAFALEWDKATYSAGDTAVLSVYMDAADDLSLFTGAFTIGFNSAVINPADNPNADIQANATTDETFATYYKDASTQVAWVTTATLLTKVDGSNTSEENEKFDSYLKFSASKLSGGSHENSGSNKAGYNGSDFDPAKPILVLKLVVADGVADGTAIEAAITQGTKNMTPAASALTAWKYYSNPGNATTSPNLAATDIDISAAKASATVGTSGLAVSYWKDQIRFQADDAGKYANKFDYRMLATIDGFADIFDDVADAKDTSDNDGILEAGFIFSKSGTVDKDAAIAQINGGAATYSAVTNAYVSTSFGGKEYVMACYVGNIADADVDTALSALGYVKYMVDGETEVATFDAAQTSTFRTLYDKNASNKPA